MKSKLLYMIALGAAAMTCGCSEDFTYPPMIVPEATMKPNTTIAEMKQLYWSSNRNYCSNIIELADGSDMIIKGRVVSSDSTGNVFKNVVIEDETAAITIAINAYDLYQSYQYGQEIVVNVTGLQIGGYNGLMQIGSESSYNGSPSMSFMSKDVFDQHCEADGLAYPSKVVPKVYTIPELAEIKADQTRLCLTQSMLVRVDNVSFVDAGQAFAPSSTADRYVVDASGNRLNVRCSSYSTFKNDIIPSGTGSVTGILSYYGSDWQVLLNSTEGLEGFNSTDNPNNPDTPDIPSAAAGTGTADDPYNITKAIEVAKANGETSETSVYTVGYVVSGSIDTNYGNGTWVVSDNADGTGSQMTVYRAKDLGDQKFTDANKVKVGDKIVVYAPIINFKGNTPETNLGYLYAINGVTAPTTPDTPDTPPTPADGVVYTGLVSGIDGWTINNVVMPEDLSYVWHWDASYNCLKASAYVQQNFATDTYITTTIDLGGYTSATATFDHTYKYGADIPTSLTFVAREAGTTAWTVLTIPSWPTGQDWTFVNSGDVDLKAFAGKKVELGFRYVSTDTAAATWEIKNLNISASK